MTVEWVRMPLWGGWCLLDMMRTTALITDNGFRAWRWSRRGDIGWRPIEHPPFESIEQAKEWVQAHYLLTQGGDP